MRFRVALLTLLVAAPAMAQQKKFKIPHCAEVDSVPALKAGYRGTITTYFDVRDSSSNFFVDGGKRFLATAKLDGRTWKGTSPVNLTVMLQGGEIAVVQAANGAPRGAIVLRDSTIDLGPALSGRREGPAPPSDQLLRLPMTVLISPDALLRLVSADNPAIRIKDFEFPVEKAVRVNLAGLLVAMTCGGSL